MLSTPFYDPTKSYEENYDKGPYGNFADGNEFAQKGEPAHTYYGEKVYLPFGIPAGPLLNAKYCKAAFEKGFDICVYKTIRSRFFPSHPFPNILPVEIEGNLTLDRTKGALHVKENYSQPLSITNSFGVPSQDPTIWQEDVKKSITFAKKGQVLVLSFMGTVWENQTEKEFIDDYVLAAKLSQETGAKVLEMNMSCPNIGNEGLVCYNLEMTKNICKAVRAVIGNTKLVVKVGYFTSDNDLKNLAEIINEYANGVAAINTLQVTILDKNNNQALPGKNRVKSGVCGSAIKWAGLDMVKRLHSIKEGKNYTFSIDGVGGVTNPKDYSLYISAGANSVFSATGAMWNPLLAQEIKNSLH